MNLFDEFQTFIHGLPTTITSLSAIREKAKFITPLTISNDDTDENFRKMSIVILQNLLNYHNDTDMFNISSLKLLIDLIRISGTVETLTKSKLMLLLHGTKLKLSSERLCSWFVKVEFMKQIVIEDAHHHLNRWKTLGSLTLNHPVVSEDCKFPRVHRTSSQMSLYSTTYHPDSPIGKSVAEIDICTIAIHEFGHARLRQITNNPNISTLDLDSQQACWTAKETPDFGRLSEMAFFFDQIDYWQSADHNKWDLDYFQQFIKAIESTSDIPLFNPANDYIKRFPSTTSGVDIDLDADEYYV